MVSSLRTRLTPLRLFDMRKLLQMSPRFKSGYGYKSDDQKIACQKLVIKTTSCRDNRPMRPPLPPPPKIPFKSMWSNPDCVKEPCPNPPPFDALYYRRSDKMTRNYQQTWNECPPTRVVKKVVCAYPKFKMPPLEKRPRPKAPKKKPTVSCQAKEYMTCEKRHLSKNKKCIKLAVPGCRAVRAKLSCKVEPGPATCKKRTCPYPCFSECEKPASNRKRPDECECLSVRSYCQAQRILRLKRQMNA